MLKLENRQMFVWATAEKPQQFFTSNPTSPVYLLEYSRELLLSFMEKREYALEKKDFLENRPLITVINGLNEDV